MFAVLCILSIVLIGNYLRAKWGHRFKRLMDDRRYSTYRLTAKGHDELIAAEQTLFEAAERFHRDAGVR